MRLRNKKTGEIGKLWYEFICLNFGDHNEVYHSLAELNEVWEDAPAEPLIKDEKIRKAVRAWAEANDFETTDPLRYTLTEELEVVSFDNGTNHVTIKFWGFPDGMDDLTHGEYYTIAELCGEEEE